MNATIAPLEPLYRHRENPDGTWDSICMHCYLTVAHGACEQPLAEQETQHECSGASWRPRPEAVARRMAMLAVPIYMVAGAERR